MLEFYHGLLAVVSLASAITCYLSLRANIKTLDRMLDAIKRLNTEG